MPKVRKREMKNRQENGPKNVEKQGERKTE